MTFMTIPRPMSNASSATTSPLASPTTEHQDRLNSFLATFEAGTHAFSRGDEWADGARISKQAKQQPPKQQLPKEPRRASWANALSLLREQPQHFDPSRDPKLHALI